MREVNKEGEDMRNVFDGITESTRALRQGVRALTVEERRERGKLVASQTTGEH